MAPPRSRTEIGREAEALVASHLRERGYVIVGQNVRVGRDELDVVALQGETLVVIEVRSASVGSSVHPLETLSASKLKRLRRGAARLMQDRGADSVRVDVASVIGDRVEVIENAVDFTST